jgi:acetylornithine deacetylase/succinyl-diaminopimelate desuccinylase-like protein
MVDVSAPTASDAHACPPALHGEVISLTQSLLRIDSTNGNETAVAEALAVYLAGSGIDVELAGPDPARANLVARVPGRGTGPSLAFVGHGDVVPADARDWTHPPFAGVLDDDGFLWGRGALDMKNEVAARAVALASLVREGFTPVGDLLLIVAADEEDGSAGIGMNWLVVNRPDLAVDLALNEGGGLPYHLADGRTLMEIGIGEKGTCPVRVDVLGEAGHASVPTIGDNPLPRLGEVLRRIGRGVPVPTDHPTLRATLRALLGGQAADELPLTEALGRAGELHPVLGHLLPALAGTTMAPTLLHGSAASNVIPARAGVGLDCRTLPGTSVAEVLADVRRRIADDRAEISQPVPAVSGNASAPEGPLWAACQEFAVEALDAQLLPLLCTGFTDSVYLRHAFGTTAYGFSPFRSTPPDVVTSGYHNRDERIHVDDLGLSVAFHRHVARRVLG